MKGDYSTGLVTGVIAGVLLTIGIHWSISQRNTEKRPERDNITISQSYQETCFNDYGKRYFIKAEQKGACAMQGLCDFNQDGWYSDLEIKALGEKQKCLSCSQSCSQEKYSEEPYSP